jgi:hypothetical protein
VRSSGILEYMRLLASPLVIVLAFIGFIPAVAFGERPSAQQAPRLNPEVAPKPEIITFSPVYDKKGFLTGYKMVRSDGTTEFTVPFRDPATGAVDEQSSEYFVGSNKFKEIDAAYKKNPNVRYRLDITKGPIDKVYDVFNLSPMPKQAPVIPPVVKSADKPSPVAAKPVFKLAPKPNAAGGSTAFTFAPADTVPASKSAVKVLAPIAMDPNDLPAQISPQPRFTMRIRQLLPSRDTVMDLLRCVGDVCTVMQTEYVRTQNISGNNPSAGMEMKEYFDFKKLAR